MVIELTPTQKEAQAKVHDLLGELSTLLGPSSFPGEEDNPPAGNWLCSEWVMIVNWMDADTGAAFLTRIGSANLQGAHRAGLLHEGLYGFDD